MKNSDRVIFEANADGVKILSFGKFDSDLHIVFQRDTDESAEPDGRTHIEINDQIRSAYVDAVSVKFEAGQLLVKYDGDNENHLEVAGKTFSVGLPSAAEKKAIAAIKSFFEA